MSVGGVGRGAGFLKCRGSELLFSWVGERECGVREEEYKRHSLRASKLLSMVLSDSAMRACIDHSVGPCVLTSRTLQHSIESYSLPLRENEYFH